MEKIEQIKYIKNLLSSGNWKMQTTKLLLDNKYNFKAELPHYVYSQTLNNDSLDKIEAIAFYISKNLDYLDSIGANYNHLLEYQECVTEIPATTLDLLKVYHSFLEDNFRHSGINVFGKKMRYSHTSAMLIYNDQYKDIYHQLSEHRKKRNKGSIKRKELWAD